MSHTRTWLQSLARLTSSTGVAWSISPLFCQLAWSTMISRGLTMAVTTATWPRFNRLEPENTITASSTGWETRAYRFLARAHQVLASPNTARPDRIRAYSTQNSRRSGVSTDGAVIAATTGRRGGGRADTGDGVISRGVSSA